MADRSNWAALVPYSGIQNLPPSLRSIGEVTVSPVNKVVIVAKLTVGGTNGKMVFVNGLFDATSYVAPT